MSDAQMSRSSRFTADILTTDSDRSFIQSLYEFMEHEKKCLQCPGEGPDELRYTVHRSVFSKVLQLKKKPGKTSKENWKVYFFKNATLRGKQKIWKTL